MANPDPISLLLVALAAVGVLIALMAYRGRVVRVGPTCKRCTFDLAGLAPDGRPPARCPECGGDLGRPRAVLRQFRRTRVFGVVVGALLAVLSAAGLVAVHSRGFKPSAVAAASSESMLLWIDRLGDTRWRTAARDELVVRAAAGSLSKPTLQTLATKALHVQGDRTLAWDPRLGTLFEFAFDAGAVSATDAATFLRQAIELKIFPEHGIRPGLARWQLLISPTRAGSWNAIGPRGPQGSTRLRTIPLAVQIESASIMGRPVEVRGSDPAATFYSVLVMGLQQGRSMGHMHSLRCPPADAKGEISVTYSLRFHEDLWELPTLRDTTRHPYSAVSCTELGELPTEPGSGLSTPVWTQTLTAPITTVAETPDLIDTVDTPAASEAIRSATTFAARRVTGPSGTRLELSSSWMGDRIPALALVRLQAGPPGGELVAVDEFTMQPLLPKGQRNDRGWVPLPLAPGFTGKELEIVLESREDRANELLSYIAGAAERQERLPLWHGRVTIRIPIAEVTAEQAATSR